MESQCSRTTPEANEAARPPRVDPGYQRGEVEPERLRAEANGGRAEPDRAVGVEGWSAADAS